MVLLKNIRRGSKGFRTRSAKNILRKEDFNYLGSWGPPRTLGGTSTSFAPGGLTGRYINGDLRFFMIGYDAKIYEINYPGSLSSSSPYPIATLQRNWGDIWSAEKTILNNAVGSVDGQPCWYQTAVPTSTSFLYWSETNSRLYGTSFSSYHALGSNAPFLLAATLNEDTGVATSRGYWATTGTGAHVQRHRGQLLRIPQTFADAYTSGKTLGIGHGGFSSISQNNSFGPSLFAAADPTLDTNTGVPTVVHGANTGTTIPAQLLISHPSQGGDPAGARIYNCRRLNDYSGELDGMSEPVGDAGWWTWMQYNTGMVWIDTENKHGVVVMTTEPCEAITYPGGTAEAAGGFKAAWRTYNPADLALVAQGTIQSHIPLAYDYWRTTAAWGPASYVSAASVNNPTNTYAAGAWFDSITNRLYVYCLYQYVHEVESYPLVHVWSVS